MATMRALDKLKAARDLVRTLADMTWDLSMEEYHDLRAVEREMDDIAARMCGMPKQKKEDKK